MVSFWPWGGEDTSPASFEKALSGLSDKISNATTKLESRRQRGRRFKALWTLYSSFAYLLYLMIVSLVIGWKNWGAVEYTAMAAAPLAIYLVRLGLTLYYDYRVSSLQSNLEELQKQREIKIRKLKAATKYDSTQQLLEKYGGVPQKPKSNSTANRKQNTGARPPPRPDERTGFAPPPTANIPGRVGPAPSPFTPQREPAPGPFGSQSPMLPAQGSPQWQHEQPLSPLAEFAPNAYQPSQYYAQAGEGGKWYDRLMDVLLGEDEAHPKNRIVLICTNCRLVNGQAPPGVRTLEDVGKWGCSGCGTMNGEESEAKKLIEAIAEKKQSGGDRAGGESSASVRAHESTPLANSAAHEEEEEEEVALVGQDDGPESDVTQYSEDDENFDEGVRRRQRAPEQAPEAVKQEPEQEQEQEQEEEPAPRKRGRPKGSPNKKRA